MAPAIVFEVPASVVEESRHENGVQVEGGSNWDLSRTAVPTPIHAFEQPNLGLIDSSSNESLDAVNAEASYVHSDLGIPLSGGVSVSFKPNAYVLTSSQKQSLKSLKKGAIVVVTGSAAPSEKYRQKIADLRVKEVSKYLAKIGVKVKSAYNLSNLNSYSAPSVVVYTSK